MNKYNIVLEAEFPILAENELEALDIANEQVKQIKKQYCFDITLKVR